MRVFLETDRLWLRRITPADVDALTKLDSDPAVMRYINGGGPTRRADVLELDLPYYLAFYEQSPRYGFWAAEAKADGAFLGWFLFRPGEGLGPDEPELGYRLRRPAWGHGYATEGSRALMQGFADHGVQRVVAYACAANRPSWHIMEKLGMTHVRAYQQTWADRFGGVAQDLVEYDLSKAGWERQEAARAALDAPRLPVITRGRPGPSRGRAPRRARGAEHGRLGRRVPSRGGGPSSSLRPSDFCSARDNERYADEWKAFRLCR